MAEPRSRKPNSHLNGAALHTPPPAIEPQEHGSFAGTFDIDHGTLKTSPRTLLAIAVGIFLVGGGVALALYRLNSVEAAIADIPNVLDTKLSAMSDADEQRRKIDCLQAQIANKSWVCPYAVQAAAPVAEKPKQRRAAATTQKSDDVGIFGWASPASAKGK